MELGGWGGREDMGGVEGGEAHDQNILCEKNLEWVALPQSPPYTAKGSYSCFLGALHSLWVAPPP